MAKHSTDANLSQAVVNRGGLLLCFMLQTMVCYSIVILSIL